MKVGQKGFTKWIVYSVKKRIIAVSQLIETAKENGLISFYPDIFSNQKFLGFFEGGGVKFIVLPNLKMLTATFLGRNSSSRELVI